MRSPLEEIDIDLWFNQGVDPEFHQRAKPCCVEPAKCEGFKRAARADSWHTPRPATSTPPASYTVHLLAQG